MRYAKIKHDRICSISSELSDNNECQIIKIPDELLHITSKELILNSKIRDGQILCKGVKKPASEMKIALVGNWKQKCGIATYNESLWSQVIKYIGDYKLFIENNDNETGPLNQIDHEIIPADKIISCWKRNEPPRALVEEIKKYNPDIIWINHEFGLWPNAAHWLSMMSQLSDYRIIVTMHSTFHHKDKTIIEAAIPEIVVHLQGAHDLLKYEKQIPGKVYVIPHGCFPCTNKERLWNFYKTEHSFTQFGFLFRYKGWQLAIETVSILKKKYPDIFFTGLCSESPHNTGEHQIYYNELMDLIDRLGVQENVALIRGFQSDQTLDSYLRTNKVAVFPYISQPGHEVFGASGAARLAMATYMPVITSSMPHFNDLNTIKADTPEEMAHELDILFSSDQAVKTQLLKQENYLLENSWENIALRYIALFEN